MSVRQYFAAVPSYYRDPDAPEPNVPRRVGVVAVIERDGSVLIDRRADDGSWAFPGGGVEEDEDVPMALAREVREETRLDIEASRLLGVFSDPTRIIQYPDGSVCRLLTIAFVVTPADGYAVPGGESLELRWVNREELASIPLWPAARPILDAYLGDASVVVA